jgi:periplasmic protein TonB
MISNGESNTAPIMSPGDAVGATSGERRLEPWLGFAAAALLHLAILLWLTLDWRLSIAPREPEAVSVRLVPSPPESAPPQQPQYSEPGEDARTTAPVASKQSSSEPAAPPPSAPETDVKAPERVDEPNTVAPPAPGEEAPVASAPNPETRHLIETEPGDRDRRADPYLNHLGDLIERHRIVPKAASSLGRPLDGTAVYRVIIDLRGNLISVTLERSSGSSVLDDTGERMLRETAPFPPPPPYAVDWPIVWTVSLYSEAR